MTAPHESIAAAIRRTSAAGRPAIVAYLTGGFPDRASFARNLEAIASEADVVEIGVPFSDPMADGLTIQRASQAALRGGFTLPWLLDELSSLARRPTAPLLLMSYLNPLLAFGLERLPKAAAGSKSKCGGGRVQQHDVGCVHAELFQDLIDGHGQGKLQVEAGKDSQVDLAQGIDPCELLLGLQLRDLVRGNIHGEDKSSIRYRLDAQLEPARAAVRILEAILHVLRCTLLHAALQHGK